MQHDYNIQNQSGADFRADLNNALSAIATVNSGASEPSTTFAHQLWVDTSNNVLKIRNAANSAFITTGVSITASNTFAGNLTGNVTGDLTGNADTATTLATARTINGTSFDGSANISFNTDSVAEGSSNLYFTNERVDDQVNALLQAGTGIQLTYDDTAGTLTIANTNDADITGVVAGNGLTGGGTSGSVTLNVAVDDSSIEIDSDALRVKAFGITNTMLAGSIANSKLANSNVTINSQSLALGGSLDLDTSEITENTNLYYTNERVDDRVSTLIQNGTGISWSYDDTAGTFTPTISLSPFNTSQLSESGNLYYTSARANADFDTRLATKSTSSLAEGTNLYYTTTRFDSAFTSKDTDSLSEGTNNLYYTQSRFDSAFGNKTTADLTENTNLYYTDTRANSAIDARVTKAFVDALGIQATSVAADSVALGTDTTGNYVSTITGTANKITVSGSGSESANITLSLPDDVQIASDLTVAGNLTVNGTLTSLDTTNLDIEDNLFQLNAGLTGSPVNDSGMLINRGNQNNAVFIWDESADKFTLGLTTADGSATGNITLNSLGTLVANLEGAVTGTVSSLSNHDTDDLAEGSNLYYTDARSRGAISATGDISYNSSTGVISFTQSASPVTSVNTLTGAVVLDTDDIGEGSTNVYFTNARADTRINLQTGANLDLSSKSTSDLSEGTNLYYTDARARASISEDSTQLSYNSTTGVLSYTQGDTDTVSEGTTNLYYTDARANSAIDARVTKSFVDALNVVAASATGNAGTATALATARDFSIAGDITASAVSFDGTGNVALSASIDANTVGISEINVTDGTSGQVLTTDGAGNLSFTTASGTTINNNADNRVITGSGTANTLNGEADFVFDGTNVGIGQSSPSSFDAGADNLVIGDTSDSSTGLTIASSSSGIIYFADGTTGDQAYRGTISYSHPIDSMIFRTGGFNERMRIDSSGNVITGSTTANASDAVTLRQDGTAHVNNAQFSNGNGSAGGTTPSIYSPASATLAISTNSAERMRIDGSGKVGIGIANPADYYSDNLVVSSGTDGGITLAATATNLWNFLLFADGTAGDAAYRGQIAYNHAADQLAIASSDFITFGTGSSRSEKMRIDTSGNVLVGGTSSVYNAANRVSLEVNGATNSILALKAGGAAGSYLYHSTGSNLDLYNTQNGWLRFATNDTERMRIDSSGNVGIGTDNPLNTAHIYGTGQTTANLADSGNQGGMLRITDANTAAGAGGAILFANYHADDEPSMGFAAIKGLLNNGSTYTQGSLAFSTRNSTNSTSLTERMRIDYAGSLLVGTTSSYADSYHTIARNVNDNSGDAVLNVVNLDNTSAVYNTVLAVTANDVVFTGVKAISFRKAGGEVAAIQMSNAAVTYNTSSDYRLKENIEPIQNGLKRLNQLNPVKFDWKEDGTSSEGFIAHEVQEIFSDAIAGEKDGKDMQGMDYGRITPLLVKAIQEQQTIIDDLKTRIEALES